MNNYLKIALLSLVCASMTGSFTSCKDYDDDINNLQQQINENKDAIKKINDQIAAGAILTSVAKSADGKGVVITVTKNGVQEQYTITNGENGKDADVWTIGNDGYWYKNDQKTDYKAIGTDGAQGPQGPAGATGAQGKPGENGADGLNGDYYKPNPETGYFELYSWDAKKGKYELKDAKAVKYAEPAGTQADKLTVTDDGINVIIKGAEGSNGQDIVIAKSGALRGLVFIPDLYLDGVEATRYAYAPSVAVKSPASGTVTGVTYYKGDYKILSKPSFNTGVVTVDLPSISKVNYELNPNNANVADLAFTMFGTQKEAINRAANDPVFAVQGQPARNADKNLTVAYKISNPKVISAQKELLTVFATEAANKEGEKESVTSDYGTLVPSLVNFVALAFNNDNPYVTTNTCKKELYLTGKAALENEANIQIKWNYGSYDLKSQICIHYLQKDFELPTAGTHKVMTLKEAEEVYGLTASFELIKYNVGGNDTNEDQYGVISADGVFQPCYVNAAGQSVPNTDENGKSSIGRRPMALVTLADAQGNIVLNGYVVFEITKETEIVKGEIYGPYDLSDATVDYLCDFELKSTWAQWSGKVLEDLKMSNTEFHGKFALTAGKTFVKVGDNYNVVPNNKFGEIVVKNDDATGEVNSVLDWTGDLDAVKAIYAEPNHTVTLYVQFATSTTPASYAYVGLTLTVKNDAKADWSVTDSNKYVPEWQNGEIHIHVAAPEASNNVYDFKYSLPKAWLNGEVGVKGNGAYNTNIKYSFRWSATQAAGYTVNGQNLLYNGKVIATLTAAGQIEYAQNADAKALLNSGKMVPAGNVQIVATYGDCEIAFPNTYDFTVRFLRPLTITEGSNPTFVPATAGGSRVGLASLFNLVDWRNMPVTKYDAATKTVSAVLDNGIDLYEFYDVKTMTVDMKKVLFKNGSKWEPLTANANANLNIAEVAGSTAGLVTINGDIVTVNIDNVADINLVELIYTSDSQGVTSQYDLQIPVTITYSWGDLSFQAPAVVKVTMGQE